MNEEIKDNLRSSERPSDTLDARLKPMESHDQIKKISSTDGKTYFDMENNILVMSDGTNKRVVIDGSSFKVSQEGYDADTATDDQLVMSSDFNMLKIAKKMTEISHEVTGGEATAGGFTITVTHDLGYRPLVSGNYYNSLDNYRAMMPDLRSAMGTDGFYEPSIFVTFGTITDTTVEIRVRSMSLAGFTILSYYVGESFNFDLYFSVETTI